MSKQIYKNRLATSYAIRPRDLFYGFPYSKHFHDGMPENMTHDNKQDVLAGVFFHFFWLLLNDVIDNNITFKFPGTSRAYIEVQPIKGDDLKRAVSNGAFQYLDLLKSDFTANRIVFRFSTRYGRWDTPIFIGGTLKQKLIDNTHKRKQYG